MYTSFNYYLNYTNILKTKYRQGADGAGCYNTICPGFIQVSKTDLLSGPIPHPRKGDRAVFPSIVQVLFMFF